MNEKYFKKQYRVASTRYIQHDYNDGTYFITICTANNKEFLGSIQMTSSGEYAMYLSTSGQYLKKVIEETPRHNPYAEIPLYVIMPNHVHLIVIIRDSMAISVETGHAPSFNGNTSSSVETEHAPSLHNDTHTSSPQNNIDLKRQGISQKKGKLSVVIGNIKSAITRFANENNIPFQWQPRFHDRIIRNQIQLNEFAQYIQNNVANWGIDQYNVNKVEEGDAPSLHNDKNNPALDEPNNCPAVETGHAPSLHNDKNNPAMDEPNNCPAVETGHAPSLHNDKSRIYPIILIPTIHSPSLPPHATRSDIHGYSDDYLFHRLSGSNLKSLLHRDVCLPVPCRAIPYEPAIALIDEAAGIFVDVEIDAPYHGWYRFPMHYTEGKDGVRDGYFNDCGWTVVRFTERQVREQPEGCLELLQQVVARLRGTSEEIRCNVTPEKRWTQREAVEMEKNLVREKYLQIQTFDCPDHLPSLVHAIATAHTPTPQAQRPDIVFSEDTHTYADARNQTGTADYTSVTTLIEKFFPFFDEEAYIQKFMAESGKSREEVIRKMLEPSERGTFMHQQIEYFLKGKPHEEDFKEFQMFRKFHEEQILRRGLTFYDAERIVTLPQYGIAGTVDALFRKPDGSFVMVDWKRSKNLIIDGYPKKYGTGRGLSILAHLDNSNYYHYELQQSFYKYILETECGMKVSSMILCVLHPDYDRYYTIKLGEYRIREVEEMVAAQVAVSR